MADLGGYVLKNMGEKGAYFILFPSGKENFFEAKYFSKKDLSLKIKKNLSLDNIKERIKNGVYKTLIADEFEELKNILKGKKFKELFKNKKFELKTKYRDYFFFWNELKH